MILSKFICLVLTIVFGCRCVLGVIAGQGYSTWHVFMFAGGMAGFITLQWLI